MADNFRAVYDRAKEFQAQKCFDDAMMELNKIIELAKDIQEEKGSLKSFLARVWNDRGHLKYLQVDFYGAVNDFTEAIMLDNKFAVPLYNRGQIHYRMDTKIEMAPKGFKPIGSAMPVQCSPNTQLGAGRYQQAIDDLTEAIRIDPTFEDAILNLEQAMQDLKHDSTD
ncbi:uncharacterized protein [Montipora capricornis]|uniref:uncharacterized protein isoform X1 n=1 Tax=Montipora capricornis TaxID=246305 RepID=UPI0035F1C595